MRILARAQHTASSPKTSCGMPWRVAFALQADGWYLRSDIIWAKPNPMPESVTDRPTRSHEYLFLLSKRERYFYDADAIREAVLVSDLTAGTATTREARLDFDVNGAVRGRLAMATVVATVTAICIPSWPQQARRLDHQQRADARGAFRHVPAEADRAVHPGGYQRARLLRGVRGAEGAGDGGESRGLRQRASAPQ